MSTIDVRTTKSKVDVIFFGDAPSMSERDVVYKLTDSPFHPQHIFIENGTGEYESIRRSDVPYLIKALQAAQDLWDGCK